MMPGTEDRRITLCIQIEERACVMVYSLVVIVRESMEAGVRRLGLDRSLLLKEAGGF